MLRLTFVLATLVTPPARRSDCRARGRAGVCAAVAVAAESGVAGDASSTSRCAPPASGQSGAAVAGADVGRAVPWVRAGIGAVCTQASTMVEYSVRGST